MLMLASYKATRPGFQGMYNRLVRAWEPGTYSHSELVFSDGLAGSASFMDKGVRIKQIDFSPAKWDFVPLPAHCETPARAWFWKHQNARYDLMGQFRFVLAPVRTNKDAFWCSEAIAAALDLPDPWRYGPNLLHAVLSWQATPEMMFAT